jgi:alkanesulfonate monooxygenase SsuD/methylene tetrahydromethanopterin reductase-like flavin-dependent oxidoreductase (luciferase family)
MEVRRDVIVRAATLADELGYEVFSVAEGWGLDSTILLAKLAVETRRITLMAGVLSVWGRTPATMAMTAATLHRLSGGRFVLGLGASTRQLAEGWHDVGYDRPAARLRTVTSRVRALLDGERATPSAVPSARALRLGQPPVPDLPIWVAATGERTIRVAADLADGWCPLYLRRDRVRELGADMSKRRTAARPITVAAGPFTIVDSDVAAARAAAAASTAAYLAMMGDIYPAWSPTRAWPPRSTLSGPRTPSRTRRRSCSTSSPRTARRRWSGAACGRGTRSSTSHGPGCRRACRGPRSKRPPRRRALSATGGRRLVWRDYRPTAAAPVRPRCRDEEGPGGETRGTTRDPERVAGAYTVDSVWRNRDSFFSGREAIVAFLTAKWQRELDYALRKNLWAFTEDRIAVRFIQYESHDTAGQWWRSIRQTSSGSSTSMASCDAGKPASTTSPSPSRNGGIFGPRPEAEHGWTSPCTELRQVPHQT